MDSFFIGNIIVLYEDLILAIYRILQAIICCCCKILFITKLEEKQEQRP